MADSKITKIEVRGANVHNLKNIDVDIPLGKFVAISGLSGSGKSSLALGTLYAEGSRRYLEALSTYTRRRISQDKKSDVQEVRHIPAAIALKQRPQVPSERSTVGSMSEVFNFVRLIFSRLGSPVCPNGHRLPPSLAIAQAMDLPKDGGEMGRLTCPICQVNFKAKSAEDFSFNAAGACPQCHGTGKIRTLDPDKLIENEDLTVAQGAIASWHLPGRNFMPTIAEAIGVRINVPYKELTTKEKEIILHGESKQYAVDFQTSTGRVYHAEKALYENAYDAVTYTAKTSKSERAQKQVDKFFHITTCPTCHGSRLNPELLSYLCGGLNIAQVSQLPLGELPDWRHKVMNELPENMHKMAEILFKEFIEDLRPLLELGLDYLTLSRNGNSLSTGELQRIQLARTLRTETTGVLYVLDEPSIGLHPDNVRGLLNVFKSLIEQGNSLVVVDHDTDIIGAADHIIEIGPGSGSLGGQVIAQGTPAEIIHNDASLIGPYLVGTAPLLIQESPVKKNRENNTYIEITDYFNLHDVQVTLPNNQITAVTGFSGAGKTSLILDSLVPAVVAKSKHKHLPNQVAKLETSLKNVVSVDASPVGKNTRSTLATYTTIMNQLRQMFAALPEAKNHGYTASYFSYNNKEGACPYCKGLGTITLDVQFLPDIEETCPHCLGTRYNPEIQKIKWQGYSIVDLLALSVAEAIPVFKEAPEIERQLHLLQEIGLDYLHLGESTPSLSGGEAQRLKLVNHFNKKRSDTLFVFDEPSVGLHPLDIRTLIEVMNKLKQQGATIVMITHDLDLMINGDHLIDLGPRGGDAGGKIMATGAPLELIKSPRDSLTLQYLQAHWYKFAGQQGRG